VLTSGRSSAWSQPLTPTGDAQGKLPQGDRPADLSNIPQDTFAQRL
jgi:hypothetical protein